MTSLSTNPHGKPMTLWSFVHPITGRVASVILVCRVSRGKKEYGVSINERAPQHWTPELEIAQGQADSYHVEAQREIETEFNSARALI